MKIDIEKIKQEKSIKELLEFSILNIDKPSGPTSFDVDSIVKNALGLRKTSHFGTLDPKVTGVLPIALNRACKLLGWFIKKDKTYTGIMKLHSDVDEKKLEEEMQKFVGRIKQLPPVRSRVKREEREREVYSWDIIEFDKEKKEVLFSCEVEAGTYIRKLISDLGEKIGGAHMIELRRTKAGIFSEEDENFVNLYEFEKSVEEWKKEDDEKLRKMLIPAEIISEILPVANVKKEAVNGLLRGKPVIKNNLIGELKLKDNENFVLFSDSRFIGVYRKVEQGEIIGRAEFVYN